MDTTSFRTAIGGFNRADVFAYIEKLTQEHRKAIKEQEKQLAALCSERDSLQKKVSALEEQLRTQSVPAPAASPAPENPEVLELETYRRAEATERNAHARADKLNRSLNTMLSSTQAQLDALTDDTRTAAQQVEQELQNMQACTARSISLLNELSMQLSALSEDGADSH